MDLANSSTQQLEEFVQKEIGEVRDRMPEPQTGQLTKRQLQDCIVLADWIYNPERKIEAEHLRKNSHVAADFKAGDFSTFAIVSSELIPGTCDAKYVVFQGSTGENDFISDIGATPHPFEPCPGISVHSGILALLARMREKFLGHFQKLVEVTPPNVPIIFTGHSLGGGLALGFMLHVFFPRGETQALLADRKKQFHGVGVAAPMFIYTEPKVEIKKENRETLMEMQEQCLNVVLGNDIVPRLPKFLGFLEYNAASFGAFVGNRCSELSELSGIHPVVAHIIGHYSSLVSENITKKLISKLKDARELCERYDHFCKFLHVTSEGPVLVTDQQKLEGWDETFESDAPGSIICNHFTQGYVEHFFLSTPQFDGLPTTSTNIVLAANYLSQAAEGLRRTYAQEAANIKAFRELRDEMKQTVLLYKTRVLPVAIHSLQSVKELCEYFTMLSFEDVFDILDEIIAMAGEKAELMELNRDMAIDLCGKFKQHEDRVSDVFLQCGLEKDLKKLEREAGQGYVQHRQKIEDVCNCLGWIPILGPGFTIAGSYAKSSKEYWQAEVIGKSKEEELAIIAGTTLLAIVAPSLQNYAWVMQRCGEEFQALSEHCQSFESAGDELREKKKRAFHKKMCEHSKDIIEACTQFSNATVQFKAIMKCIEGAPEENFVQRWLNDKREGKPFLDRFRQLGNKSSKRSMRKVLGMVEYGDLE